LAAGVRAGGSAATSSAASVREPFGQTLPVGQISALNQTFHDQGLRSLRTAAGKFGPGQSIKHDSHISMIVDLPEQCQTCPEQLQGPLKLAPADRHGAKTPTS
jgi:hypothetical protein